MSKISFTPTNATSGTKTVTCTATANDASEDSVQTFTINFVGGGVKTFTVKVAGRIPCVAEIYQIAGSQSFNDFVSYINENGLPITDRAFDWTLTPGSMVSGFQLRFKKVTATIQSNGTLYWVPSSVAWECSNTSTQVSAAIQENEESDGVVPVINALGAFKNIPVGGWFTLKIQMGAFINKTPNKQKEVNLTFNRVK